MGDNLNRIRMAIRDVVMNLRVGQTVTLPRAAFYEGRLPGEPEADYSHALGEIAGRYADGFDFPCIDAETVTIARRH